MDDTELSERYVALWNEPDPATRSEQVRTLWREDGRHLLHGAGRVRDRAAALGFPPAALEVRGHDALEFRVGRAYAEFVAPGDFRFRGRGAPTRVGESVKAAVGDDRPGRKPSSARAPSSGPGPDREDHRGLPVHRVSHRMSRRSD